ncbi:MAG: hypothetical protein ACI92O_000550 [Colwellia sp.]|jgi:hypothetical protein
MNIAFLVSIVKIFLASVLLITCLHTHANIIVSTHSDTPTTTYTLLDQDVSLVGPGFNDYAAGFVWNSNATFDFARLYLSKIDQPLSLDVSIFSDINNSPYTELHKLTGTHDIFEPNYYTFNGTFDLIENERYWIVASTGKYLNQDNQYIWWKGGSDVTNNYLDTVWRRFEIDNTDNEQWSSSRVSPAMFTLHAVEVPEPTTLAIFALGMIGLASRRFK